MKQVSIKNITNVHSDALKAIELYLVETSIFKNRLSEIVINNTGIEVLIQIEYFQNLFIIHQQQLQILKHQLHENLQAMAKNAKTHSGYIDEALSTENTAIYDRYLNEEQMFKEMKIEFYHFAEKWM